MEKEKIIELVKNPVVLDIFEKMSSLNDGDLSLLLSLLKDIEQFSAIMATALLMKNFGV